MNRKNKTIAFGDKIFARVTRNGQTIFNFVSEKVANMAQLISELRFAIKDVHGLVMIHIRNYNKGWGEERPLMLYAPRVRNYASIEQKGHLAGKEKETPTRQMYFPWEIH